MYFWRIYGGANLSPLIFQIMARIKFGMMMTDARGKLGGQVFSKTRSGSVIRTKVTPVNPQTQFQSLARAIFSQISQRWRVLTAVQRNAWSSAAEEAAKTNVFGDQYFSSGKNFFQEINGNILNAGYGGANMFDTPPLPLPAPVRTLTGASFVLADEEITLTLTGDIPPAGSWTIIEVTPYASAGKRNFSGSYRKLLVLVGDAALDASTIYTAYTDRFGIPPVRATVGIRVKTISASGAASPYSAVVASVEA